MPDLLDQLRDQRAAVRTAADEILTRAASESRDLTAEELADHGARTIQARELDDRIEQLLADEVAELRAAQVRQTTPAVPREPVLTRDQSVADWCQQRGMFDATTRSFRSTGTSGGWPPPGGMGPSTSGRSPRPPSGPVVPWCRRPSPVG